MNHSSIAVAYLEALVVALPDIASKFDPMAWRALNNRVTLDAHIDFEDEAKPAYFRPEMFREDAPDDLSEIEERALEALSLYNLEAAGYDLKSATICYLEQRTPDGGDEEGEWIRIDLRAD